MTNKPKFFKVLSTLAVSTLLLSACGGSGGSEKTSSTKKVDTGKFNETVKNDKKEVKDGSLTYGLVSNTPFEGLLNFAVYEGDPDNQVITFFDEGLLDNDKNWEYNNEGAATYEISADKKTITLKIKDNVKWHDGNPVTAEDLEYSYLVIGSKLYA
ncbi:ABC transporter substrate-binding protein, partial [Bacillus toyonensis]